MKKSDIAAAFDCSDDDAKLALQIMNGLIDFDDLSRFPKTEQWISSCYHKPNDTEIQLHCLDELLDTYGVEVLSTNEWIDSYYMYIRASYLNTGDTYTSTIILDHKKNRWLLSSWGDFVEAEEGREFDDGCVEFN